MILEGLHFFRIDRSGLPYVPQSEDRVIIQRYLAEAARDKKAAYDFMTSIPLARKVRQA